VRSRERRGSSAALGLAGCLVLLGACARPAASGGAQSGPEEEVPDTTAPGDTVITAAVRQRLQLLSPATLAPPPADATNRYADNPAAAALGKKFFFDTRFSGPLLDDSNDGTSGTLGKRGDVGKVACASCHVPASGFFDSRTNRRQISLGAGWTRRRAPSLLDVSQHPVLMWDGRRDTAYNQVFGPIENPVEFNSSRLFVAQQVKKLYQQEYESVFGPFPSLAQYEELAASDAGCGDMPAEKFDGFCARPGTDDPEVTRVVVNLGKAIQAYERSITCGPSRFDEFMAGNPSALSEEEQQGAALFVGKAACDSCHSGPYMTDSRFHNVGLVPATVALFFIDKDDRGAAEGLAAARTDPLNSKGAFSDGDDGRLDKFPADLSSLEGAFKTPSLRCVGRRSTYMHTGQYRSLEDAVAFFGRGGATTGYIGTKENFPRDLSDVEQASLVAFLRALDGPGPSLEVIEPPDLP
jgi:cytochrome c peroxidase